MTIGCHAELSSVSIPQEWSEALASADCRVWAEAKKNLNLVLSRKSRTSIATVHVKYRISGCQMTECFGKRNVSRQFTYIDEQRNFFFEAIFTLPRVGAFFTFIPCNLSLWTLFFPRHSLSYWCHGKLITQSKYNIRYLAGSTRHSPPWFGARRTLKFRM